MNRKELRKKIFQMLKDHYRLIIYNDSSIQTVWSIKLTPIKVLTLGSLGAILLILLTTIIIAYTPLRENIPGYPSAKVRQQIIYNYMLVDSLENEIKNRDSYFEKIRTLFQGEVPADESVSPADSGLKTYNVKFKSTNADSIFQDKLLEEKLNLSISNNSKKLPSIANIHFFTPLRGLITNKFKNRALGCRYCWKPKFPDIKCVGRYRYFCRLDHGYRLLDLYPARKQHHLGLQAQC